MKVISEQKGVATDMAVMNTHISWTDSTWNPTTGCTKVSDGCKFCYAEAITHRLKRGDFAVVVEHPKRLGQVHGFQPIVLEGGTRRPRLVFVNSMSDLMHEDIADSFRDLAFDAMEGQPRTVFQVLTKRMMTMRRYIEARYKASRVPPHIWLGCSVEDNRVSGRIDAMRRLKDAVGDFTAFLSVEPLIGPVDRHDYHGIEQVLIGGESGRTPRDMLIAWPRTARDRARRDGAAVWFKQFGAWKNNPLYQASNERLHIDRVRSAIAQGEREAAIVEGEDGRPRVVGEKGGATLDGEVLHEYPPIYATLRDKLNA